MHTANVIVLSISLVLEIWLAVLVLRRGVRRHFSVFFTLALALPPVTALRLLTLTHYQVYFHVYWWSNAILLLFGLAALDQVFRWVYEGFYRLWWFRLIYYGGIALVLAAAVANAVVNTPVQAHPVVGIILDIGIAVNLLQLGIAGLFGVLSKPLEIAIPRYPLGIATGFAVSSMGPFVGYLARSIFGTKVDIFTQNASAVAYILALAIWVATFARPEPEARAWTPPMPPEEMLRIVREYLRAMGLGRKDLERKEESQ